MYNVLGKGGAEIMSTYGELVSNYLKKHPVEMIQETYIHTYEDGSTQLFEIYNDDKYVIVYDKTDRDRYEINVPSNQLMVTVKTDTFPNLDWFDGKRFKTVKSAIKAIEKEAKRLATQI